jgi:hypothetical protein
MIAAAALFAVALASIPPDRRLHEGVAPSPAAIASVRRLVREELAVPGRYHLSPAQAAPSNPPWWAPLVTWVRDRFNALWNLLFGRVAMSAKTARAIGDAVIALLVLATAALVFRIVAAYGRRSRSNGTRPLSAPPDAQALYAASVERAERREYAAAARLLFAATLALLAVRGTVHENRSATVGEIRRTLRSRAAQTVPAFDDIASAFVTGTYAEVPPNAAQWESARRAYLSLAGAAHG